MAIGRRNLLAKFHISSPCLLGSGEVLATHSGAKDAVYHIQAGWACQFHDLAGNRRAIVDVYLPGDVVGLD
ncbi:hypothetical protein ACQ7B2_28130, partial [Escherichia coli]